MLQNKILENINDLALNGKLSHLFLLQGEENYSFDADLVKFINAINNSEEVSSLEYLTPNVLLLDGSEESIKKDEFDSAFYALSFSSTTKRLYKYSILVIKNIENTSINGLNSILKSIEEPSEDLIIVLTTNNINALLDTIISRAQVLRVESPRYQEILASWPSALTQKPVALLLAYLFKDPSLSENEEFFEAADIEIRMLINAIEQSFQQPEQLFIYLDNILNKDNLLMSKFILLTLKAMLLGKMRFLPMGNQLTQELSALRNTWYNHCNNVLNFVLDIDEFINKIKRQAIFELQKQIMLNKLMEYYG
ncbi:hypothetical protein ACNQ1O_00280 [Mycoplasma sp. B6188]|uniref:hypothetical protein n=1 Tax=Mycoplasma sp. B6188 TaxID=3401673 RepID=UPI003AAF6E1B